MIVSILGASGSGKSLIEKKLIDYNFKKIIPYTTRTARADETNGKDYFFITNLQFEDAINKNLFAEYNKYPDSRLYGTLKTDYITTQDNKVVVITPNSLRQIYRICERDNIFSVYVKSNLGARVKRYIERCGINDFDFKDMDEISSRVNRDFGMFLGIDSEVDMVIENNEGDDIENIVDKIIKGVKESRGKIWTQ